MHRHFFRFTWEQVSSGSIGWLIPLADALHLEPARWKSKPGQNPYTAPASVGSVRAR